MTRISRLIEKGVLFYHKCNVIPKPGILKPLIRVEAVPVRLQTARVLFLKKPALG
jgi:hypothetical protein